MRVLHYFILVLGFFVTACVAVEEPSEHVARFTPALHIPFDGTVVDVITGIVPNTGGFQPTGDRYNQQKRAVRFGRSTEARLLDTDRNLFTDSLSNALSVFVRPFQPALTELDPGYGEFFIAMKSERNGALGLAVVRHPDRDSLQFLLWRSGAEDILFDGPPSLRDCETVNLVATTAVKNGDAYYHLFYQEAAGRAELFLDGELVVSTRLLTSGLNCRFTPNELLCLGGTGRGIGFVGDLDELRIYQSVVFTPAMVRLLANQ